MTTLYQSFEATYKLAISGELNTLEVVKSINNEMEIEVPGRYIYITKQQAMAFFGLVDPAASTTQAQGFLPPV